LGQFNEQDQCARRLDCTNMMGDTQFDSRRL
jgi:hypothetical protein